MQNRLTKAVAGALLCCVGAGGIASAQTTTVAGITPGQFAVSESGAATYRIPIQVPPGVAGMEPKLELSYNSQGGNGLLGVGWSLSGLSAITRCPRTMAQDGVRGGVNFDLNDRYCMDGQRLVLVSGTYGTANSEYRTELDSFSRIIATGTAGNGVASFTVQTKAGLTMEYGNTADSRIEAQGKTSVRVWAINKISDVKTNFMTFSYTKDVALGDYYPSRIDYTGNATTGLAVANSVQFTTEGRPDVTPLYHAGSMVKSVVRLKAIKTTSGSAVKQFLLTYVPDNPTDASALRALNECDGNLNCRATNFTTQAFAPPAIEQWSWASNGRLVDDGGRHFVLDVNGDGKADLITIGPAGASNAGVVYVALSQGNRFDGWSWWSDGRYIADNAPVFFADVGGRGIPDLIAVGPPGDSNAGQVYVGRGNGAGFDAWTWTSGGRILDDRMELFFVDVSGDGKADLVAIASPGTPNAGTVYVALSNGTGFDAWTWWSGGRLVDDNAKHFLVDVNGDGKADLINIGPAGAANAGVVYVALSNGVGFDAWTWNSGARLIGDGGDVFFADVNGDGKADLVAVGPAGAVNAGIVYVSLSNGLGFDTNWTWNSGVRLVNDSGTRFVQDVNGDGRADLVYIPPSDAANAGIFYAALSDGSGFQGWWANNTRLVDDNGTHFLADVTGDGVADLITIGPAGAGNAGQVYLGRGLAVYAGRLQSVVNTGDTTSISYSSLSMGAAYAKDSGSNASAYPKADLQFPMYVVTSVGRSNGVGGTLATQYSYGGLKAELGTGRGMLGFRWMKSKNLANGIESYTEFNQGWPFTGSVAKAETRLIGSGNAAVLKRTTNSYAQSTGSGGTATFVYPSQSVEESWDLNGTAYPAVTNAYVYGQSPQYGDPTQITVSNSGGSSKTTANEYWPASTGSGSWVLGRLKKASVTSVKP